MKWAVVQVNPLYEVSDAGRVRRIDTGRTLDPNPRVNGYISVSLSGDAGKRRFYVHRLVADAFLGGCPAGLQVNHINFNRADNRAANLEVVTCAQNAAHSKAAGRTVDNGRNTPRGDASPNSKLNSQQVANIRALVAEGALKARVARQFGITKQQIANIVERRSWR